MTHSHFDLTNVTEITLQGHTVAVPVPFAEGYVLRENDANALNQVYAENIRNNIASQVRRTKEQEGRDLTTAEIQTALDEYVQTYDFGMRVAGSGPRAPADPIEAEALRLAKEAVKTALRNRGVKLKEMEPGQINDLAQQVLGKNPQLRDTARANVEARKDLLSEIDLS